MPRIDRPGLLRVSLYVCFPLLCSCIDSNGIAPASQVPDPAALEVGAAIASAEAQAGWPASQWWRAFGDPQLDAWMDRALAGSPSLDMAAARVRQARALAHVVEADESPSLGVAAKVQRKRWPDDAFYGPGDLARTSSWNNTSQLGFSYPLDLWGRERARGEAAVDRVRASVAEARLAALELQGNLVRAYIGLALHHSQLDIAQAELTQRQQLVGLAKRRRHDGIGTRLEVTRAEMGIPPVERQIDELRESIALDHNLIAALAGEGPGAAEAMARPRLALLRDIGLPPRLPLELLGHRPDLVAARWQVAAEAKGIEAAKADFYPNVDLLGGLGTSAVQGGVLDFLRYDTLTWGLGPALSLPVYDGGRRRGQLAEASAGYDLAVGHYDQTLVQAIKGVADALVRLESLHQQQRLAEVSVAQARHACDLTLLAQQRGLTDYSDVLQAQPALFEAQRVEQQVRARRLAAQADLLLQLGGGLPQEAGPAPEHLTSSEPRFRLARP
ncbi:efflux transporter outer membrane subunit [Metapseudomonas otitidis]|uniref:efflux transporter outer membrane subunit n=1 Tax=Metapseudomonas otitidis TaxID=319939 RepID=UPI0013F633F1|nr:efflux transporter outer membrane subunit [Pseudomonas otitidis]